MLRRIGMRTLIGLPTSAVTVLLVLFLYHPRPAADVLPPAPVSTSASPTPVATSASPTPVPTSASPTRATKPTDVPVHVTTLDLYPLTAIGDQHAIDQGHLVTWMTSPTCLLAGHDNMGWAFLAHVAIGERIVVHGGPCAGTYRAVAHNWQPTKGGAVPSWMGGYPLVLQSCTGAVGMGFTMATRE